MSYVSVWTPFDINQDDPPYYFQVDNTKQVVSLAQKVGTGFVRLRGQSGGGDLQTGDSFKILSFGFFVPDPYTLSGMTAYSPDGGITNYTSVVDLLFQRDKLTSYNDVEFNTALVYANYEMAIEKFIPGIDMGLGIQTIFARTSRQIGISMLNVPASENGKEYYCWPWLKIEHSLPLL